MVWKWPIIKSKSAGITGHLETRVIPNTSNIRLIRIKLNQKPLNYEVNVFILFNLIFLVLERIRRKFPLSSQFLVPEQSTLHQLHQLHKYK